MKRSRVLCLLMIDAYRYTEIKAKLKDWFTPKDLIKVPQIAVPCKAKKAPTPAFLLAVQTGNDTICKDWEWKISWRSKLYIIIFNDI